MRELRARRKAENEDDMLQKQRQYQKHYNTGYINIRKNKPVYNDPPFQYENEKEDVLKMFKKMFLKMFLKMFKKILHLSLIKKRIKKLIKKLMSL